MIEGRYYLAEQSDYSLATLSLREQEYQLLIESRLVKAGALSELQIADRLGNISRKITFPDGAVFETTENDEIDFALKNNYQAMGFMGFIHLLERHMGMAILSIFLVLGVIFASFKWGLPAASHIAAQALPESASQALSGNVLEFLDEHFFESSELSEAEQKKLSHHFFDSIVPLYQAQDAPEFTLHFRKWSLGDESVANAFALPSGDIIVTDRFIQLAKTQDEIDIVLLHEMGHVVERHSLEQVIEGSAIVVIVSMAFGDVSWLADVGIGMGSFFISSFYSRSHESEADMFAYQHSLRAGIAPKSLGIILNRMEDDMGGRARDDREEEEFSETTEPEGGSLLDYFSTHPSSAERMVIGERYQLCFEQEQIDCINP